MKQESKQAAIGNKRFKIPFRLFYRANAYLITTLTNLIGEKFTATHMTFGAIHEMSTGQGYRWLMEMANHPVLNDILTTIMREESAHTKFCASVARIELGRSEFAQKTARFIVNKIPTPAGQGAKPKKQTDYTIGTLLNESEGVEWIDRNVTQKIQTLPGLAGLTKIPDTAARVQCAQFV